MQISKAFRLLHALLIGAAVFSLFTVTGCATPDADTGATYDPLTVFPSNALWVWNDARIKLPNDDRIDNEALDRNVRAAIAAEFGARGYSEAKESKVHYILSYEVSVHTWMSQTQARAFGSLSVLMTEAASGRRVWLGFMRMQIDMSLTPDQRSERLRNNVALMLENFPPAQPM